MRKRAAARRAAAAPRQRAAGLLLHPTCLPGPFPIGDLGPGAHSLLDWLVAAGLSHWQLLPLGPTGYGDSPYFALSGFAGNPLLVSPERLVEDGLLAKGEVDSAKSNSKGKGFIEGKNNYQSKDSIEGKEAQTDPWATDFAAAAELKESLHRAAWTRFRAERPAALVPLWEAFRDGSAQAIWLGDWCLYAALKARHGGRSWLDWEPNLRDRRKVDLLGARRELAAEIEFRAFEQFLFFRQWRELRAAAEGRGIRLVGDLPFYPALDSADVWAHRELFELRRDGSPRAVAGVPPDYFAGTGQLWGNPLHRWERLAARGFDGWIARVRHQLELTHLLRLDHFRGFVAYWRIPAAAATAEKGRWVDGPGAAPFTALRRELGALPLLAEDLGEVDERVHALRRKLELPGMRVLQFGFDEEGLHTPHRHAPDAVVFSGTHDNDSSRGWFGQLEPEKKERVLRYLGATEESLPWAMVRAAMTSAAELAIVPLQDLLGLGSEARLNTPGRQSGNWSWRVRPEQIPADLPGRFRDLVLAAWRLPPKAPNAPTS